MDARMREWDDYVKEKHAIKEVVRAECEGCVFDYNTFVVVTKPK